MTEPAFPDVRWGRDPGPAVMKVITGFLGSKGGAWLLRHFTSVDARVLRNTAGRRTLLGPFGVPLLLLTTTGRKSGRPRQIALTYLREGDRLFVVGSNFGQSQHPAWTANLLAEPNATVAIGGQEIPIRGTQLAGAEADRIYQEFVSYAGNYGAYRDRARREIRVFALARR
ncbi:MULTISPECIES: nitroreductase/quinone reductase family protein [unclassified Mycobacterium]|uniref:nitroreductase/quinone reductase family protein n=1 Tax=unclassified Mycobacterium TaxID=2642494 RepID=UPI0007FF620C|nr:MULTISPECIES: nitroreductase/quinone reductase family protein [unclassified Mycobacterium]OBG78353.1 nitroreductase [Mycobacterium sp. E1214]OBH22919.1 nitroreductase [Mycobacterium sp. E1319]